MLTNEPFDLFTSNLCDERHFILECLFKEKNSMNINLYVFLPIRVSLEDLYLCSQRYLVLHINIVHCALFIYSIRFNSILALNTAFIYLGFNANL